MVNCVCKCEIVLERRRLIMHVTLGCLKMRHGKAVDFHPLTIFLEGEAGAITFLPEQVDSVKNISYTNGGNALEI
jgi:hypothetical protein